MLDTLLRLPGVGSAYWRLKWKTNPRSKPGVGVQNAVLQNRAEWEAALSAVRELGLPPHEDPPKNWDSIAALRAILAETKPTARVLDAGAETYSAILPWLASYGYRNLIGTNLVFRKPVRVGPIVYEHGDITKSRFEDGTIDVITCLSVIEHNVDVSAFLHDAARTLMPGGLLILSADYFDPPIDTGGKVAYGGPVKVFCAADVGKILDEARGLGLVPTSEPKLTCGDKCVTWSRFGLSYTFLLLTLRKQ
jgi:SAM-dependent methyltransferase